MTGPRRIARGLLTDAAEPLGFRFDGRPLQGLRGDTLASALLANGVRLTGRSFKYHRPRGIVTAGPEEPCALVDVIGTSGREPNRPATTLELHAGLVAESQNRWPSLRVDAMALSGLVARFLPAGFYYKTFMAPGWAWERVYEPLIRRAAGLGRLEPAVGDRPAPAETVHDHAEVLVIGAGVAGLAAAHRLGTSGARVILADQDAAFGGGSLLDRRWTGWREALITTVAALDTVRCLPRTTVVGAYGHGVFGALETLAPAETAACGGLRERLRVIRARRVILATGAVERLIAFPGNDVPGVMLAGAALAYLRRYGVAVGHRPALFLNTDEAYETVFAFADAGIGCAGVIDPRPTSLAADRARGRGRDRGARRRGGRGGRRARRGALRPDRRPRGARSLRARGRQPPDVGRLFPGDGAREPGRRGASVAGDDRGVHTRSGTVDRAGRRRRTGLLRPGCLRPRWRGGGAADRHGTRTRRRRPGLHTGPADGPGRDAHRPAVGGARAG
jgi:methylglutamate dehydrogenase subunit C